MIPAALASGSLWRDRDFRTLWGGQSVSELGSQISVVALPLLAVLVLHADAFAVGVLEAAASVGFLLVSLPAGALVDRWRRRPVLAWTNLARALVLGSIPVAWALGSITLVQLDAVALTAGCLRVFFDVAWQSYLPSLVAPERLVDGNGKLEASAATARVGGPALAGFLVAAVGGANAIAADAASFVVGWGSVVAIRRREPIRTRGAGSATPATRLTSEIADGVRFVVHHDVLRRIVAATATSNFGGERSGRSRSSSRSTPCTPPPRSSGRCSPSAAWARSPAASPRADSPAGSAPRGSSGSRCSPTRRSRSSWRCPRRGPASRSRRWPSPAWGSRP